ncbi:putative peptidoglycan binding protein [Stackebrandtia endophytica]|uniref:Putative peptidoglycan binding protein n=1 Tax=Stackebrandtia endophytica TaxID=1496996 RepID=A0A543B0X4_9ACTN|nr:peptidoglycan DD-metalloendopeptidase family protein [Stackebrandtia endophytica]TQL78487.1 putative peptidoglycan binding protein [Stackebrandtia endophytica]
MTDQHEESPAVLSRRTLFTAAAVLGVGAAIGTAGTASAAGVWGNPTYGTITSGYKTPSRPTHLGTDVANSQGTNIYAANAGKVVGVRTNSYPGDTRQGLLPGRTGNAVLIDHENGYRTYYGHLYSAGVSNGQRVVAGQYIAAMGTTGNSTGPHLHFEVHYNGVTTNPYTYLKNRGITLGTTRPLAGTGGGWATVKQGAAASITRVIQYLLRAHGYTSLVVDGDFGSVTHNTVRSFQAAKGLVNDGVVGPITWARLILTVQSGSSGDRARAAQTALNRHSAGLAVDGQFGSVSVTATKNFQGSKYLLKDGQIGTLTWQALI